MKFALMIILVGTSGAGKSTLGNYVLCKNEKIKKLIAITDRPPRMTERDGVDKFFVSPDIFQQLNQMGKLCLVNKIYEHMYAFRKKDFEGDGVYIGELHYERLKEFIEFYPSTISIYIKSESNDAVRGLYFRGSSKEEISIRKSKQLAEIEELNYMCNQGKFDYIFHNKFKESDKQDFYRLIEKIIYERGDDLN